MATKPVHVAVAVIKNAQGQVLLALRGKHQHQGGLWEFPGGKIEPNESFASALARELDEEIGITVIQSKPLITIKHHYGDKTVLLEVHLVTSFSGVAEGREGQQIAWVDISELRDMAMPAANRTIVNRLVLPDRYLITPEPTEAQGFLNDLQQRLAVGDIQLMQLRAHSLSLDAYIGVAQQCLPICHSHGVKLLLNGDPNLLDRVTADGLHLTSQRLSKLQLRPLVREQMKREQMEREHVVRELFPSELLLSASCHNLEQLEQAASIGADMAVLGPVLATPTHPGGQTLGWTEFQTLVSSASLPVYALGGMDPGHITQAQSMGAQGIAAISRLWS